MPDFRAITNKVLKWYAVHQRVLPWRTVLPEKPDVYKVWVSEIMLQQTTVVTVQPYFLKFIARFPTVQTLAAAPLENVLVLWSGLGYYSRARRLHETAQRLAALHSWPQTPAAWETFPGVGKYTAAAVCALAFQAPVLPVDANIRRLLSRLLGAASQKSEILAAQWSSALPKRTPWGDLAQGLMDLGALFCYPKNPACAVCPLAENCVCAQGQTPPEVLLGPAKRPFPRPIRCAYALCLMNEKGDVYVEKEEQNNLLKGLWRVPIFEAPAEIVQDTFPFDLRSLFSHFEWRLHLLLGPAEKGTAHFSPLKNMPLELKNFVCKPAGCFVSLEDSATLPFSSLMTKILKILKNKTQGN
ncbi:A/G-specific adenine glycosylase [Alphaproteobacteria bacterium]|nr:A/G-specific adenine glycosylase [Alphaproteobacteria bacterium]GHS99227.1 A/G-specific adenine glycosylase [Alphaproteobacteria bacterium]